MKQKRRRTSPLERHAPALAMAALLAITSIAYSSSFASGFVLDNRTLILADARVHEASGENFDRIMNQSYWGRGAAAGLYRPVTTLSYLLNYAILGNTDDPAGYHWFNLILHAGNVLLLFALSRRLLAKQGVRDVQPAFLIAALWAVHPVLTESVTNIIGRADLLAGMATLAGLLIYLKSAETPGRRRIGWLAGLAAVTLVGVFSKESAVALPAVIVLYELTWWNRSRIEGMLPACIAMFPALLAMWIMRGKVLRAEGPADFPFVDNPLIGAGFRTAHLTALKVMAKYLGLLAWPANLSFDYSYDQIPLADGHRISDWFAWTVVALGAMAVVWLYRRNKVAFFAAVFAILTLLPASNLLVPVGAIMAERFLYLPAAGFAICLTLALYRIARRLQLSARAPLVAGLLIVAVFSARTWARNRDWKNDITVGEAAVRAAPLSFKTHMWAGSGAAEARPDRVGIGNALAEMEKGLAIIDRVPDRKNDAAIYYRTGVADVIAARLLARSDPSASRARYVKAHALLTRARTILNLRGEEDAARTPWLDGLYGALTETNSQLAVR